MSIVKEELEMYEESNENWFKPKKGGVTSPKLREDPDLGRGSPLVPY